MQSIRHQEPIQPTEPAVSRLRTVTGNRFARKCACGCGLQIPPDPEIRCVVDFGAAKPYPAYLREHSPDYGAYQGTRTRREDTTTVPGFRPASEVLRESVAIREREVAHEDADATAIPEAGRAWASGQLVFNAGQFENARRGFADYPRGGKGTRELKPRGASAISVASAVARPPSDDSPERVGISETALARNGSSG